MTAYSAEDLERETMITARLVLLLAFVWIAEAVAALLIIVGKGWVV
jgi:hypothetical protein